MNHRIRVAALILQDNRLLLVKEDEPALGKMWWCPPGGGLEGEESIYDCVTREVWEETGIAISVDRIVYVREFIERRLDRHNLELFMRATVIDKQPSFSSEATRQIDDLLKREYEFLSRADIQHAIVYPELLRDVFWQDVERETAELRYLGVQHD